MVDLSVVLPAYNEALNICGSLERLARYLRDQAHGAGGWRSWEIVVVDDGSSDGTAQAARAARPAGGQVRVIELASNSGKGAAIRAGLAAAAGQRLLVTDVDLSYALEDLGCAAGALREGADMVTGDRRHPDSRIDRALSARRYVARRQTISAAFNLGVRALYGVPWRDTQCGLKGFRREAAEQIMPRLRTRRFLADIEMFIVASRLGMKVATIPVHLTYLSGDSTVHVVTQAPAVLADALRIKLAQLLRRYDGPVL